MADEDWTYSVGEPGVDYPRLASSLAVVALIPGLCELAFALLLLRQVGTPEDELGLNGVGALLFGVPSGLGCLFAFVALMFRNKAPKAAVAAAAVGVLLNVVLFLFWIVVP